MPIKKASAKALKQSQKKRVFNLKIKQNLDWLERQFRSAVNAGEQEKAKGFFLQIQKAFDKAGQKKVLKKNTAGRKKSRLWQYFQKKFSSIKPSSK